MSDRPFSKKSNAPRPCAIDLDGGGGHYLLGTPPSAEWKQVAASKAEQDKTSKILAARFPEFETFVYFPSRADAVRAVFQAAREITGREEIVRFRGCFHGEGDPPKADFTKTRVIRFEPALDRSGQCFLKFNDTATVEYYLRGRFSSIAAVIADPTPTTMSLTIAAPGFLPALRAACTENGLLCILDDGNNGFRFFSGASWRRDGCIPDILILGDAHAGGRALGIAAVSRGEPARALVPSLILQSAPPSADSLEELLRIERISGEPRFEATIHSSGAALARGLESLADDAEFPMEITRLGSCVSLVFPRFGIRDNSVAARHDITRYQTLVERLTEKDVYLPKTPMTPLFVSFEHTPADIDRAIIAFREILESYSSADDRSGSVL